MGPTTTLAALFCLAVLSLAGGARDPNIRLTVNSTIIRDGDMIKVSSSYYSTPLYTYLYSGVILGFKMSALSHGLGAIAWNQ